MELWDSLAGNQVGASIGIVYVLEWMKKSKAFPWLTVDTATANRYVSLGFAAATTIGFQFAMTGSAEAGGTITIAFPPLSTIPGALFSFALSYGSQQIYYKQVVCKPAEPKLIEEPGAPVIAPRSLTAGA